MEEKEEVEKIEPIMIIDYPKTNNPKTDTDDWAEFGDHSICSF